MRDTTPDNNVGIHDAYAGSATGADVVASESTHESAGGKGADGEQAVAQEGVGEQATQEGAGVAQEAIGEQATQEGVNGAQAVQADATGRKAGRKAKAKEKSKTKRKRRRPRISTILALAALLIGAGLLAYPTFSDWWNSYHQTRAIANYVAAVENTDPAKLEAMLQDAHDYNDRLLTKPNRYVMSDAEKAEYESLLNLNGDGVMGYVQISTINVDYPIYHGLDEAVLQVAIGHLDGSSLPVGGPNTHAVISGHRGLPSARLFTDLDRLVEGDTFTVTVLNETCTYEIDQIRIVLPENLSNLNIESGQDYCTLVTCTPYGINTHRMLVRGHRIENIADTSAITAEAVQIPRYIAIPAVGVPMLFVFLVDMLIYYRVRRPALDKQKVTDELRESIRSNNKGGNGRA